MRKALLGLACVLAAVPHGVSAAEQRAIAGPGAIQLGYATSTITISKGDTLVFSNLDAFDHNIVHDTAADGFGGKKKVPWCKGSGDGHEHGSLCPVFWSELIGPGASTEVLGLNRVKAGKTYSFFCTRHHSMKGTLTVNP